MQVGDYEGVGFRGWWGEEVVDGGWGVVCFDVGAFSLNQEHSVPWWMCDLILTRRTGRYRSTAS